MGWQLAEEVQRDAPPSLTFRERYVLTVYAHSANDQTRELRGSIERPDISDRLHMPSRSERYAVRAALIRKGALERLQQGRHGNCATFRIPVMAQGPGFPDPDTDTKVREQQQQVPDSARIGSGNSSSTVRLPDDVPSRAPVHQAATAADPIDAIMQEIERRTGRRITREQAAGIKEDIIGGRQVRRPSRYLRRAIQNEPDPARRFLPHSQLPPPPPPNDDPADPAHVAAITDQLRQQLQQL
jgi:hypothetical protein